MCPKPFQKQRGPVGEPEWRIEQEGFEPAREHELESIFTVGNGYLGVRGALDTPMPGSQGDLFIAGIYDQKQAGLPYSELEFLTPGRDDRPYSELVSFPFPFRIRLSVDGQALDLMHGPWRDHRRVLDLKKGMLYGRCAYEDDRRNRTLIKTLRCASMLDPHLLLQEIEVTCETFSANVELDMSIREPELKHNHPHLIQIETEKTDSSLELYLFETKASALKVCIASRTTMVGSGEEKNYWQAPGNIGAPLRFQRYVSVFTSRDNGDPLEMARRHALSKKWDDFSNDLSAAETYWSEFWQNSDVKVGNRPAVEQALRFNTYHLRIAADHDPKVSVGARTLSGRGYEGHIFWDTEIFMLPFYIHTCPSVARSLLLYRYNTLDGARKRAGELGYSGACYAWESTVTGEDVTPRQIVLKTTKKEIPILTGTEEVHITADVAYGVWQYWDATHDEEFMREAGVEILIETARFWASRCTEGPNYHHIRGVIGPDEYHYTVSDNAYTNWMAKFNLEKAVWAVEWMTALFPERWEALASRLRFDADETKTWDTLCQRLFLPQSNETGVIEQFEGFFDLDEQPLQKEERFKAPISRLFEADQINRLKLIKQADVLMLLYLFPDKFPRDVVAANYRYYEPITDHGSSLSPSIHAAIAWRLGLGDQAERYWRQSLWLDLSNVMGNSILGVHAACMGGTWQALVFGLLGTRFTDNGPVVDAAAVSSLPAKWKSVALKLAYRGQVYTLDIRKNPEDP
jgi:trehalose/maltose hydrolase-like predicted phosphorylase